MSKYKHYESYFNIKWMEDSKYKKWLQPTRDSNEFYCSFCRKTLSLRGKGVSALNEHMKTKLHTEKHFEMEADRLQEEALVATDPEESRRLNLESIKCRQTF